MLDSDDYLVISRVNNGFLVTVNNDEQDDNDRVVDVFNDVNDLLEHVGQKLGKEPQVNQSLAG